MLTADNMTNSPKTYSTYSSLATYAVGAFVSYSSQIYKCILEATNELPTNATYWEIPFDNASKQTSSTITNQTKN
jgi:hypothetical protein